MKYSSPATLQYIFITDKKSYLNDSFTYNSFELLKEMPLELSQIDNTVIYFENRVRFKMFNSYELFSFPSSIFSQKSSQDINTFLNEYFDSFSILSIVRVYIIDAEITNHNEIANFIKKQKNSYYTIIGNTNLYSLAFQNCYPKEMRFKNSIEFIALLKRDINIIKRAIDEFYKINQQEISCAFNFEINPKKAFIKENKYINNSINTNNYYLLNQIIGNFWLINKNDNDDLLIKRDERIFNMIEQCKKIDSLFDLLYLKVGIKLACPIQPIYPTLIIVAPYHFPKLKDFFKENRDKKLKCMFKLYTSEQSLDYTYNVSDEISNFLSRESNNTIFIEKYRRLTFLDNIAYLHAIFNNSPVIRLPEIGKSINLELSHFEKLSQHKRDTILKIEKFGKKLSDKLLDDNLKNYLRSYNRQIFAITDLPLEWLYLDNLPLCFTHDICRLPEFNTNSIVNNVIALQRNLYNIPKNLLSKTLVIHCASEEDSIMNNMFLVIDNKKQELGFNSVRCSSIEEIKKSINDYSPELIIFDCHGIADKKELTSYLVINEKKKIFLKGDDIVKHKISAPLIFLSACETFRNYGNVKTISDAFMEAGAYCVTTTFLPIKIVDASYLILRLLQNIKELETKVIHMNWLNFISHLLRTSLVFEIVNKINKKTNKAISPIEVTNILVKMMHFDSRIEAINDLDNLIKTNSNQQFSFTDFENEWLSYSIIGRADLLLFENWLERHKENNLYQNRQN